MMIQEVPGSQQEHQVSVNMESMTKDMGSSIHLLWDLQPVVSFFISNMEIIRAHTL